MNTASKLALAAAGAIGVAAVGATAGATAYALGKPKPPPGANLIEDFDGPRQDGSVVSGDGTRLHTRSWGPEDGPLVVLVHGWTCNVRNFPMQVPRLVESGHRVVAYDQRGHGESEPGAFDYSTDVLADDLHAVLRHVVLAGRTAVLIGHSMGAISIMAWAGKYPEEVQELASRAVLLSTFAKDPIENFVGATLLSPLNRYPRLAGRIGYAVLGAPTKVHHSRLDTAVLRYSALCGYASYGAVHYAEDMVGECDRFVRSRWGRVMAGANVVDGLRCLTVPTSVVVGQYDHLTPPSNAEYIAAELRLAGNLERFAVVRDAGHMVQLEQPEKVNTLIGSILSGEPVAAPTPQPQD
jgi:pimeloyl-ACP methyl ester carboxylesterase